MTLKLKIACIQNSAGKNVMQNINQCVELVKGAHADDASLICLPEYFTYLHSSDEEILNHSYSEEQHPALEIFCTLAKQLSIWILLGSLAIKVNDHKLVNRSYLINSNGLIITRYDKLHLFDVDLAEDESYSESTHTHAGDRPVLASTPWGSIGMTICYDLRFAYLYRHLAHKGATFFTIPAAFTKTTGEAHWHILNRARAIETGTYVIAPCQCGEHPGKRFTYGHSLIINPWGIILAEAGEEPGFITADIDVLEVQKARQRIPSLQHDQPI